MCDGVLVIVGSERWLCGIINEFPGQARGSAGVLDGGDSSRPGPLLGPTRRPQVSMETGPYLAAGLVRVRGR